METGAAVDVVVRATNAMAGNDDNENFTFNPVVVVVGPREALCVPWSTTLSTTIVSNPGHLADTNGVFE